MSRDRLNAIELVPFRAAVKSGVGSVMTGHIGMPQIDPTAVVPLPRDVKIKPLDTDEGGEVVGEEGPPRLGRWTRQLRQQSRHGRSSYWAARSMC